MKKLRSISRQKIKAIAKEYAESEHTYSHSFFEREYEISESTFYTLLKKAIIESIVDENIAKKIAAKAKFNAVEKAGESAGIRVEKHHQYLIQKRKIFKFSLKEAGKIAVEYSQSTLNKSQFCDKNAITTKLFDDALENAIVSNLVDDDCVETLKCKALKTHEDSSKVIDLFAKLDAERKINKEKRE